MRDLAKPIARPGESIYASIVRNRSGIDAGKIDFGVRVLEIEKLCDADKIEIRNIARALYQTICDHAEIKQSRGKQ